jgi:endonuclease I
MFVTIENLSNMSQSKRQKFNQSKLYKRRSVTTTRGIDISPQFRNMKSDIHRPTSSSGVENYKRNGGAFKDQFKQDNILLRSNPLDLYDFKESI